MGLFTGFLLHFVGLCGPLYDTTTLPQSLFFREYFEVTYDTSSLFSLMFMLLFTIYIVFITNKKEMISLAYHS